MSNHSIRVRHGDPFRRALLIVALLFALTAAVVSYLAVTTDAGADTITLLPNGDRDNDDTGWERSGGTDCENGGANSTDLICSSDIDEDVDDAGADTEFIQTESSDPSDDDVEFNFDDPHGSTNQISQVIVRFRARYIDVTGTDTPDLEVSLRNASGNVLASQTFTNITTSFATYSFTFNTTLSQAQGDGLYVRLRADGNRRLQVSALNLDLTYSTVTPNPTLASSCGIDMVLVIDSSGSIDSNELATMKTAFKQFVAAFLPETPTQIGIVEFDTTTVAPVLGFTNNETTLNNRIDAAVSGGFTNWEDGLQDARALFPGRVGVPDLLVFASDGNPNTVIGGAGGATSEPAAVLAAVNQANLAKADGIRIMTLGIGNELDQSNLESISSEDAYFAAGFDTLAATLAQLADDLCGGTITVQKIIDTDGNPATQGDQSNGANWTFNASATSAGDSVVAPATAQTDVNGQHNFDINLGGDGTATVTITETLEAGFGFISASCTGADNNGSQGTNSVTGIALSTNDIVNCKFYNQPGATFTVNKNFIPDSAASVNVSVSCTLGATVTGGTQAVSESSPKQWTVTNFSGNPVCTATESPIPAGYTASGSPAGTCQASLLAPAGSCTITNTRNDTTFTVNKTWIPASSAGVSVTVTCTSGVVVEGAQTVTTASPKTWNIQGYTTGASCTATESPVPLGYTASGSPEGTCSANIPTPGSCTITNSLAAVTFTVNKTWVPASAASVSVTVSCTAPATASPGAQNVSTATPGSWTINNFVVGVTTCTATESPIPAGYTASGSPAGTCTGTIQVSGGSCTITNTRRDSTFTVNKVWSPASGAGVSVTVTCTSGNVVEGAQTVTTASPKTWNVQGHLVGATCTATETIPAGYTANGSPAGTCTAGIPTPGACTITNTRNDTTFTVNKIWSPASGASVSVTVTCTSGVVVEGAQSVSTASPKTWTVQGYTVGASCTATESPIPAGYTASGSPQGTCLANIPSPGSCTITNTRNDTTFTVNKVWSPASGASVSVTVQCTGGGTVVEGAQSVSTASPKTWNIQGFVTTPTCTATESPIPAGYTADGSPEGTCQGTAPGQCTITNRLNSRTFTVHKLFTPDLQGGTVTVSLSCSPNGGTAAPPTAPAGETPDVDAVFTVSGYTGDPTCTATETNVPAGYTTNSCNALLSVGQCTITNVQTHADFRVTKDFIPDLNNGTVLVTLDCASGTEEGPQLAGETPNVTPSFDVDGFTGDPLCTATETNVPAGYSISQCSALLSVGTCQITNTLPATIVVQKTTNPAADPQTFVVQLTGPQNDTGSISDATDENFTGLQPGTYTITELNAAGWKMDGVSCNGGNPSSPTVVPGVSTAISVTVDFGDTVTCTYSNTKLGTIIVQKTTNPAGDATQFPIGLTGPTPGNGTVTDALDLTFTNREPGNYTVTETLTTPPWVMTSVSCPPSTQPAVGTSQSFTLPAGGTITCLFVNRTETTFDVYKNWVGETKPDTVTVSLVCESGSDTPESASASETLPATFTVTGFSGSPDCTATETPVPGYISSGICTADLLDPGECTINNTLRTGDFQVIKDFVPNPSDPNLSTSISLVCDSGTVPNSPQNATDTVTADFTVNGHSGDATICTATETLVPGYDASGNPPGTCQATILVGVCTITNTQQTFPFEVHKDFQPDIAASVQVTLSCTSGAATPNPGFATEATPASFTVTAPTGDPDCTATELVPQGYDSSGTCTAKLSAGQCTIVNVLRADTFTVHKDFSDDNTDPVSVVLICLSGTVSPPNAQVTELAPFTFDVTGFTGNPVCIANENPVPDGYDSTSSCQALLSVGQCTIVNTLRTPTPSPTPQTATPSPTPTNPPTGTPVVTPTPTPVVTATPTEPPTVTPVTPTVEPETFTPAPTPTDSPEPTEEPATQTPVITAPPTNSPSPTPSPTALPATQTPKATPTALPVTRFPNTGDLPLGDEGTVAWLLLAAGLMAITMGAAFTVMARKR